MIDEGAMTTLMRGKIASVEVSYRFVDGYHIFTSPDLRGLYVASKDAEKAFESVAPILEQIVACKMGRPCLVEQTVDFDEFMDTSAGARITARPSNRPKVVSERRYVVREVPHISPREVEAA